MVAGVEMPVETDRSDPARDGPRCMCELLGRHGDPTPDGRRRGAAGVRARCARCSPISRLPRRPCRGASLCELLWDVPNDPRGELRWCLSKLRSVFDGPGRRRVDTPGTASGSICRTAWSMPSRSPAPPRRASRRWRRSGCGRSAALFKGEFLDGLEIDRNPAFNGWLTAQRRRFRGCHAALLEHLRGNGHGRRGCSATSRNGWSSRRSTCACTSCLLNAFARRGRIREGEEHLAATARLFEAEGPRSHADPRAWRAARAQAERRARAPAAVAHRAPTPSPRPRPSRAPPAAPRRASIAVMPFVDRAARAPALRRTRRRSRPRRDHRLAKLRSLFVIAQGTVFALQRAARRPGGGRPHAQRRLRRQRVAAAPGRAPHRRGRAGRDAHRPHRLGRGLRPAARTTPSSSSTRSATASSPPSPARSRRPSATAPS